MNNDKNVLRYKGYSAKPEFLAEEGVIRGKILGINDLIDFQGESVNDVKSAFCEAVDDYLSFCAEVGKEPQREYSGCFNVRINSEIHRKAVIEAQLFNISLNRYVEMAISKMVKSEVSLLEDCKREIKHIYEDMLKMWPNATAQIRCSETYNRGEFVQRSFRPC